MKPDKELAKVADHIVAANPALVAKLAEYYPERTTLDPADLEARIALLEKRAAESDAILTYVGLWDGQVENMRHDAANVADQVLDLTWINSTTCGMCSTALFVALATAAGAVPDAVTLALLSGASFVSGFAVVAWLVPSTFIAEGSAP